MDRRITAARAALGDSSRFLGHHYQRDEVIKFADYTGDSYKLASQIAGHPEPNSSVLRRTFMAESADVLCAPHQQVILPDLAAGCSMADRRDRKAGHLLTDLEQMDAGRIVPCTYINSSAAIKAFCGERGGVVCTSSNAAATLKWAWERGERILFLPDQHLGRNTAFKMGVPLDRMVVWDPNEICGGLDPDAVRGPHHWGKATARVHERFSVKQIEAISARIPECGSSCTPKSPGTRPGGR